MPEVMWVVLQHVTAGVCINTLVLGKLCHLLAE